MDHRSVA